jgi:outer membrane protein insertion porin family
MCAVALVATALPLPRAISQVDRVMEVDVVGNERINIATILGVVQTRPGEAFSPEQLERDRRAIESLGWFKVVAPPAIQQLPGGVRVVFIVTEWPCLSEIQVRGNTVIPDSEIRHAIQTRTGQVFNLGNWQSDVARVEEIYKNKGYVAQVIDNIDTPEFSETGVLRAQILELTIDDVNLEGLHKTRDYVVMRRLRQRSGKLYNTQKMAKDYQELRRLDYFDAINSRVDVSQPGKVVVTWEFKEKQTGQASVGVGYSAAEGLVGRGEIAERNLMGTGRSVSLAGELGGTGVFGGNPSFGGPSFEANFTDPWINSDRTSLSLSAYDKRIYRFSSSFGEVRGSGEDLGRYAERRIGGQVAFGRPFGWPITTSIRHDLVDTSNFPRSIDFPRQDGQITDVAFKGINNTRNYPQYPTQGVFDSLTTDFGFAQMDKNSTENFSESLYTKLVLDVRRYFPLRQVKAEKEPERERESQKVPVFATRLMAGTSAGQLPFFEQFFLGGADSLRGYIQDRFWGANVLLASAEYRHPLANRITGVIFADVGDAWGTNSDFEFRRRDLRTRFRQTGALELFPAIGIGARVATPIGPIRLDYGFGTEGGNAAFSIGQSF